jgi:predicted dehydrogenase
MINLAFVGVSHWHLRFYLEPALQLEGVRVVGVADPDASVAAALGERLSCEWSTDYVDLCHRVRPDFVFALGRHSAMAETAGYLIGAGIPFAMEKPCGLDGREVAELAAAAQRKGAFAAVPFVFRQSDMVKEMERRVAPGAYQYLSFRMIGRPVARYFDEGSSWMVEKEHAGGGAFINLGIHFIDLFRYLCPGELQVVSSTLGSEAWSRDIEDYGIAVLRSGSSLCTIETGYLYPGARNYMDMRYSLRAPGAYFSVQDGGSMEISDYEGKSEIVTTATTNVAYYPAFVRDVLRQFRSDEAPVAGLSDAWRALEVLDRIYELGVQGAES